jgi:hypothetical protein
MRVIQTLRWDFPNRVDEFCGQPVPTATGTAAHLIAMRFAWGTNEFIGDGGAEAE